MKFVVLHYGYDKTVLVNAEKISSMERKETFKGQYETRLIVDGRELDVNENPDKIITKIAREGIEV